MLTLLTNLPKDVLIQQIKDGGILLVLGMGTVFLFLVILIFATKLMSKIVMRIQPAQPAAPAAKRTQASEPKVAAKKDDSAAIAAAIAAAYDKNR